MTKIIGISAFYHDSAATLIENGIIIAAAQEERFSRKKHDDRFPINAIKYLLENSKSPFDKAFDLRKRGGKRKRRKTKKKGKRTRKKRGGETPVVGHLYQSKSEDDYPILQQGYRVTAVKENHVWFNGVEEKPVFERDDDLIVTIVEFPDLFMPQQTEQPGGRKKKRRRKKKRKTKKKRKMKKSRKRRK